MKNTDETRRRTMLVGTAEEISIDPIPEDVQRILDNPGFYIGYDQNNPDGGEAPLVSIDGKIFSLRIDSELDPTRFIAGHQFDGPFRAGFWEELPHDTEPQIGDRLVHGGKVVYVVQSLDPDKLLQDEFYPMKENFGCTHTRRRISDES